MSLSLEVPQSQRQKTALDESYFDAGVIFRGMMASRPADTLAFGWITANVNTRKLNALDEALAKEGARTLATTRPSRWSKWTTIIRLGRGSLHPTVQYWIDPGATTFKQYKNAWLLGGQVSVNF